MIKNKDLTRVLELHKQKVSELEFDYSGGDKDYQEYKRLLKNLDIDLRNAQKDRVENQMDILRGILSVSEKMSKTSIPLTLIKNLIHMGSQEIKLNGYKSVFDECVDLKIENTKLISELSKLKEKAEWYDEMHKAKEYKISDDVQSILNMENNLEKFYKLAELIGYGEGKIEDTKISNTPVKKKLLNALEECRLVLLGEEEILCDQLDKERIKKGKYTMFGGGHRKNSCEFEIHGTKCEHGDCTCTCHDDQKIIDKLKMELGMTNELWHQQSKDRINLEQKIDTTIKEIKEEIDSLKHLNKRHDESFHKTNDISYVSTINRNNEKINVLENVTKLLTGEENV